MKLIIKFLYGYIKYITDLKSPLMLVAACSRLFLFFLGITYVVNHNEAGWIQIIFAIFLFVFNMYYYALFDDEMVDYIIKHKVKKEVKKDVKAKIIEEAKKTSASKEETIMMLKCHYEILSELAEDIKKEIEKMEKK